jgi:small-conductance mechanosensitive channel
MSGRKARVSELRKTEFPAELNTLSVRRRSTPGRREMSRLSGRIAIAITAFMIVAMAPAAGHAHPWAKAIEHPLFERTPPGFSWKTVKDLRERIAHLPQAVSQIPEHAGGAIKVIGVQGVLLRFLLLITIIAGFFVRRRISAWLSREMAQLVPKVGEKAAPWVSAAIEVGATTAVPAGLWLLYLLVAALTNYENAPFVITGMVLVAWTEYALAVSVVRELITRPLLTVPAEHRSYLFNIAKWLLIYGIFVDTFLRILRALGEPADAIALRRWIFQFSLIVFLAIALLRRRAIMSLFPDLPNRMYQRFVHGLDRVYPLAFVLTLFTALLQWAGYRRLAIFVWIRTWALAGVFVLAVLLHYALRSALRRMILGDHAVSEEAKTFYASTRRLLDYVGSIAVVLVALKLTDLNRLLMRLLGVQLATLSARPLTLLVLIEAAVIVAGFIFVAQLLRDYLQFQVYPALNVDPGVARAIDTFIVYSLAAIGGLAALEAVGLGVGTITLFAGAIGVGLGFGLQSIANNFASGLTIIFSRELRRGDIVTVADTVGVVEQVGTRATRVRSRDDVEYVVPNSDLVGGKIINWTRSNPHVRLHVPLGVSYGSSPEQVREILERVANTVPAVERHPPPEVWFMGFGDSSLNFELLVWMNIRIHQRDKVASDLYFAVFEAFTEAGIEIPFPQRDLHIRSAEGLEALTKRKPDSR